MILDQGDDDPELQKLEERERLGENTEARSSKQQAEDRQIIKGALEEAILTIPLNEEHKARLREICFRHIGAFAMDQTQCQMSRLEPIKAFLTPDHPPINQKARLMSHEKLTFLKSKIRDLLDIGMLKPAHNPIFGSPVFVVPKKGNKFRMVVDLRLLNKHSIKTSLDLPHLENQLMHLQDAKFFASFDVVSGFDFLPVDKSSQHIFTITTPFGAYEMKGAPMGWLNTPMLFQARIMQEVLEPIGLFCRPRRGCLQWIDDTLLYSDNLPDLFRMMDDFLAQVERKGLHLSVPKCVLFTEKAEFCGRIFEAGKWNFKEKFWTTIRELNRPRTVADVAQAIHVAQWLSVAVPDFAAVRDQLDELIGRVGNKPKRTLRETGGLVRWTPEGIEAWERFKIVMEKASRRNLSQYDHSKEILLLTDASKHYWSGVVLQIPPLDDDIKKVILTNLEAQPLMFMSGKFKKNQTRWHISQRELYPIIHAFHRFAFLLMNPSKTINIVTDHAALRYILDPSIAKNKSHAERLTRWALTIQQVRTRIFHNPGKDHQFADLLSRWGYAAPERELELEEDNTTEVAEEGATLEADAISLTNITRTGEDFTSETGLSLEEYTDLSDRELQALDVKVSELVDEALVWIQEEERQFSLLPRSGTLELSFPQPPDPDDPEIRKGPLPHTGPTFRAHAAMSEKRKKELEKFSSQLGEAFAKDDISFFNPYYEGEYFMLDNDALHQFQVQDGQLKSSATELRRDNQGRIMLKDHRLPHLVIAIHVQNHHMGLAEDLRVLRGFSVEGRTREDLNMTMKNYRNICLHCARYPHLLRIPLNKILVGRQPRAVLRMDFLSINKAGHLLVIIDTFSRKTYLKHTLKEDARTAVEGLLEWHAHYVLADNFIVITDNGSHFANDFMKELTKKLRGRHDFAVPFAPWTNGSCENRNKTILRILRQLCSELTLTSRQWPDFLPLVMSVVNNLPIPSRGGKAANELFLGARANAALVPRCKFKNKKMMILEIGEDIRDVIQDLQDEWVRVHEHRATYDQLDLARDIQNKRLNKGRPLIQFRPGDWVLYSTISRPNRINKLQPVWVGPYRVIDVPGKNVYLIQDVFGKQYTVHASRLWFYNTEHYVPREYVQKIYRQHWTGLELDHIHSVGQDNNGNIEVKVIWYGFPDEDPEALPLQNVLEGAHLLLDKYVDDHKNEIKPSLYREIKRAVQDRITELEGIEGNALEVSRTQPRVQEQEYLTGKPQETEQDIRESLDQLIQEGKTKLVADSLSLSRTDSRKVMVSCDTPTYLKGWTATEVRALKQILKVRECGNWPPLLPFFPAKNKSQIIRKVMGLLGTSSLRRFQGRTLEAEWGAREVEEPAIKPTFDRDLRQTKAYRAMIAQVDDFIQQYAAGLHHAIEDKKQSFRGLPIQETIPNYYEVGNMLYRYVPRGALWRRARIEDIIEEGRQPPVDLLYVDPPWRLMDYGKQSLSEVVNCLAHFPSRLLALWVVNFVYLDVIQELDNLGYEIIKAVDWIKLTRNRILMRTLGYYLQHSKETLLIARRRMGEHDRTKQIAYRDLPDMIFAQQTRPSGKPREAQRFLERWFPEATDRLELYARNNNLRAGWKAIGNQLQKEGVEAVFIDSKDIPREFKPERPPREGVT